jgi:DNA polymerase-3 subunit delta
MQDKFQRYFEKINIFERKDVSLIIFEEGEPDKRNKFFKILLKKSFKKQEFSELPSFKVKTFIENEVKKLGGKIVPSAIDELILFFGNDLWQIENELQKLITYKGSNTISKEDVESLGTANIDLNIFRTIEAISRKNKKLALKLVSEHFEKGENELKILSMINYQFRVLIKIKSLLDEKKSFFQIQKTSKIHPFVIKKTIPIARNFSMEELKNIYKKILETDFAIKTGKVEPKLGIEIFVSSL